MTTWNLTLGAGPDFHSWSFGQVRSVADLYSPQISGPERDLRCECGKYADDPGVDGTICDECGVRVSRDARRLRKTRLGHIELACPCQHPLGDGHSPIESFPIAPIAFRLDEKGEPNALGKQYEALIGANQAAAADLPDRDSTEYYHVALGTYDRSALQEALDAVVGRREALDSTSLRIADQHSLFAALIAAIARMDPGATSLLQAMGCTIHVEGRL